MTKSIQQQLLDASYLAKTKQRFLGYNNFWMRKRLTSMKYLMKSQIVSLKLKR